MIDVTCDSTLQDMKIILGQPWFCKITFTEYTWYSRVASASDKGQALTFLARKLIMVKVLT